MWAAIIYYLLGLVTIAITYPLIVSIYVQVRDTMIPILYPAEVPKQLADIMPYLEAAIHLYPYISFALLTIWLVITLYRYSVEGREYRL